MVSILSRRADDVRNPGQHRQQGTRSETVIGMDILQPEPGGRAAMHQPATTTASARAADVQVPPPAYTGLELPLVRTSSSGRTLVNPTGSRRRWKTVQIEWAYHPAISGRWYIYRLLRFLRMDKEVLKPGFPEVFEELLDEGHVDLSEQEKIRELYAARISHLNEWVIPTLAATRLWMALTEILVVAVLVFLIVALVITKGRQTGVLTGAEVAVVMLIVLAAGFVNQTRLRRWRLQSDLRMLSREWSPLPLTSTSSPELMRAYLGERDHTGQDLEASVQNQNQRQSLANTALEEGLKPCTRWKMVAREGSVWTSWRPVIMVELIVPTSRNSLTAAASRLAPPPILEEDYVPKYSPREAAGERTVQFA